MQLTSAMGLDLFKSLSLHFHHCFPQGLHLDKSVVEYILSSHVKDHASKDATHTHPHQGSQEEGEGVSGKAARRETVTRGRGSRGRGREGGEGGEGERKEREKGRRGREGEREEREERERGKKGRNGGEGEME